MYLIQQEVKKIKKGETNPYFKSKYFDINQLITDLKPLLSKYKLLALQPLTNVDGKMALQTTIVDTESAEEISNIVTLTDNTDPQKMGSAITYFRRYALQSLFFLQAEDDDANKASGKEGKERGTGYLQSPDRPSAEEIKEVAKSKNPTQAKAYGSKKQTTEDVIKNIIKGLCDKLSNTLLIDAGDYHAFVSSKTGMLLAQENYDEIINKLESLLKNKLTI